MKKIIVILLSIMMAFTLVGCGNKSEETEESETAQEETVAEQTTTTATPMTVSSGETEKKETVYALLDATGQSTEIIVSDELKNFSAGTINDKSDLADIENVKGDETFTQNGTELTWNSTGENIYYQGTSTKQLPITVKVTYTLDGNEISANDIVGKSGHVTIRYDFTNNTSETVDKKSYIAPFICLGGTILDNTHFRNIKLTNGEAIDDGEHTAVAGYALPGVINSLNLKEKYTEKIGDKSYFMIEADATDFTMSNVFLAVSNSLTNDVDSLDTSSFDDLTDDIDELADGMQKLRDGAYELAYGADELKYGLAKLVSNNDTLTNGSAKVYNLIIDTVKSQIKEGLEAQTVTTQSGSKERKYTDAQINELVDGITKDNYKSAIYKILGTNFDRGIVYAVYGMRQDGSVQGTTASDLYKGVSFATYQGEQQVKQGIALVTASKQVVQAAGVTSEQLESAISKYETKDAADSAIGDEETSAEDKALAQIASKYYEVKDTTMPLAIKTFTTKETAVTGCSSDDENTKALAQVAYAYYEVLSKVDTALTYFTSKDAAYAQCTSSDENTRNLAKLAYAYYTNVDDNISTIAEGVLTALTSGSSIQTVTLNDDYSKEVISKVMDICMADSRMKDVLKAKIEKILTAVLDPDDSTTDPTANISENTILTMQKSLTKDQDLISTLSNEVLNDMLKTSVINKDESTKKLLDAITNLADYGTFNDGLKQYTDGVYSAYKGSRELAEGASELEDGIKKFDDEGISKLVDVVKNDLKVALDNLDNLKEASKQYDIYTDKADGVKSSVSFVYRIDAVESDAE